ncbi:hypothetical protein L6452_06137 [Arctium lappa]|uniref:Uncharacterized protein n=1 Tax=Arctium lappa TaxID=4217 RepID=A0ACB9EIS4_ARCLA|nr:hypothetical protein L6452_06137 [Arctium lappa]
MLQFRNRCHNLFCLISGRFIIYFFLCSQWVSVSGDEKVGPPLKTVYKPIVKQREPVVEAKKDACIDMEAQSKEVEESQGLNGISSNGTKEDNGAEKCPDECHKLQAPVLMSMVKTFRAFSKAKRGNPLLSESNRFASLIPDSKEGKGDEEESTYSFIPDSMKPMVPGVDDINYIETIIMLKYGASGIKLSD